MPGFRTYDYGKYHRLISPFFRQIWQKASAVVANSNGLRELGVASDAQTPIEVIPNGVDMERFKPLEKAWNPGKLLFVGHMAQQKVLDIIFEALGGLFDLEWKSTLVGDGNRRPSLKAQAEALKISDVFTSPVGY